MAFDEEAVLNALKNAIEGDAAISAYIGTVGIIADDIEALLPGWVFPAIGVRDGGSSYTLHEVSAGNDTGYTYQVTYDSTITVYTTLHAPGLLGGGITGLNTQKGTLDIIKDLEALLDGNLLGITDILTGAFVRGRTHTAILPHVREDAFITMKSLEMSYLLINEGN